MNKPPTSESELPETITVAELSPETQDVLQHFGVEAPEKLNKYCITLEDALIEQIRRAAQMHDELKRMRALLEEHDIPFNP